jgi:RNA polymerase sigma-70 factor (ECF subfamily)
VTPTDSPPCVPAPAATNAELLKLDALVERARGGDLDAFTQLVRALHPRVHRWALALAADPDEADDVTQEVFVIALRRLGQYRGGGAFPVWLHQITRRSAGHHRRRRARRTRLAASGSALPERTVYETDPGARVDRARISDMVRRYWSELPDRQREVLDLVDLQGLAPAEVAELLSLNQATVRANLFKARQSIRGRLLEHFGHVASDGGSVLT